MNVRRMNPLTGMVILMFLAALSGGAQAWISGKNLEAALRGTPREAAIRDAGLPLVRVPEMRRIVEGGTHLILDARSMEEYDRGHLPGAMPLPLADFEHAFPGIAPMLSPDDPLVVYCSGPRCDDALLLGQRLKEAGFANVSVFLDGWQGWSE